MPKRGVNWQKGDRRIGKRTAIHRKKRFECSVTNQARPDKLRQSTAEANASGAMPGVFAYDVFLNHSANDNPLVRELA